MQIGSATDANVILPAGTPAPKTDADKKLLDAAKQFEGVFVQQLVQEMLKSARGDDTGDAAQAAYQDMADQTMTSGLVDSGAFGLAGTLYAYMKRSGS
jgi:Rod binding domain-containing protein